MKKIMAGLLLAVLLAGCSDPRLDASNEQAFEASLEQVIAKLDESQRRVFTEALMMVMLAGITQDDLAAVERGDTSELTSPFRTLDGLTADEVIARAEQLRAGRKTDQGRQR